MVQLHWGFPSMLNSRKRRSLLQFQKKRIRSPPLSEVKINIEREFQVASPKRASCTSRLLKAAVFFRTVKAAIFIHLLLALLLVLISQIPVTAKELSCHHANNFARSFHIMLHYINGPPPT
ncbi:SYNE1 protein, partial [Amia calva]|nr:SYNE1 protein [Amia calva]